MQWSLFLLLLMGQCSFFMCHHCEYHFVEERKTWEDAKKHCREKHTDLATVFDMTDVERLLESAHDQDRVWIGLYRIPGQPMQFQRRAGADNRMWHWSLPGVEFNDEKTNWAAGEPQYHENCVCIRNDLWLDFHCTVKKRFICYNESQQSNEKFKLIDDEMTWPQAQSYCREKHTDLVSGDKQLNQLPQSIVDKAKNPNNCFWIGLFRDTWRWSDESSSSFRYWHPGDPALNNNHHKQCAMTTINGKWSSADCHKKKPFFCYNDKMILINKNKTWEEALNYCRENYRDLVSITNRNEQRWVQEKAKKANSPYVWLGLRYTCTLDFWFWVNDDVVTYENWVTGAPADDCDMSGAMDRGGDHQWFKKTDNEKFNFICSTC